MTADDEIRNIQWTLEKIHRGLYQVDKEVKLALPEVDRVSAELEQILTEIINQTNSIRDTTVDVVSYFPSYSTYVVVILILEIIAVILAITFLCSLIILWKQWYFKQPYQYNKVKNRKSFGKSDKNYTGEQGEALVQCDPISSFDISYKKNGVEWWIELGDSNQKNCLEIEKI